MKALVIGAARSGISVSKLLVKNGYEVYLTDAAIIEDKNDLRNLGIYIYDEGHPEFLKEIVYDLVVKNPGIPYRAPFVKCFIDQGYFIYTEIEIASKFAPNYQYASITGTNGKTTTTALLEHILKLDNKMNTSSGNIGTPLSEVVLKKPNDNLKIAMEISGFQLLGIDKYHPCVSVCTNLAPDHLDYFDSLNDYYASKMLVFKNQNKDDWFIRNCDDPLIVALSKEVPCTIIDFSMYRKADLYWENQTAYLFDQVLFHRSDLKLVGNHNVANAMMAACMAYKMGLSLSLILKGIQSFTGVEHRIEYIDSINKVQYYNDSKSTTVESTIVALDAFEHSVILLAGGYDKKTGFDLLAQHCTKIKHLIAYGETKIQIKKIVPSALLADTLEEALIKAYDLAQNNDIVLLSPMCASYDQFKNFEDRGNQFKTMVAKLKGENHGL